MNDRTPKTIWTAITLAGASALAALLFVALPALAQQSRPLPPGAAVDGRVTSALGEEWELAACAGDVLTLTMESADFAPFLSVLSGTVDAPLVEAGAEDGVLAQAVAAIEAGGVYTVFAAGERRSDRGAYTLAAVFEGDDAELFDGADGVLSPGALLTGSVRTSAGARWLLRGCADDVVTVTATSGTFSPFVELFDPAAQETISESIVVDDRLAAIEAVRLPATGLYELFVAGERRSDRGAYTLTLSSSAATTAVVTGAPPTATLPPVVVLPPEEPLCTVTASPTLNLRAGPGTAFAPPLAALRTGAQLSPLARNRDASWIEVRVVQTGARGWVSAGVQFIECNIGPATLPLGALPPTPTPAPTSTLPPTSTPRPTATATLPPVVVPPPTPTQRTNAPEPTPTLPPLVVLPGGGPGGGGWRGVMVTGPGTAEIRGDVAIFRDRIFFGAEVSRTPENRRIDRVEFSISDDDGEFYRRAERTYRYCSFGGGEPNCNVVRIERGARWPDTNQELCNGNFTVFAEIFLEGDDFASAQWNSPFRIDHPELPQCGGQAELSALEAYIVQTGPGSTDGTVYGALVFQIEAFDPERGFQDGDGIDNVDMRIFDVDGTEVYQRTENTAAYCAFAGGEPDCNVWIFADNGDTWPSGEPVRYGEPYLLLGIARADDGRTTTAETVITIQP